MTTENQNQTQWLDRYVAPAGPYLALCLSEAAFLDALRDLGVTTTDAWVTIGASATAHHFVNSHDGEAAAVVCMRGFEGRDPVRVAALLVHEAVHVWQRYSEKLGEVAPGSEQEAYAIQYISGTLMDEFARQITGAAA